MRRFCALVLLPGLAVPAFGQPKPHNVVLFVADGLRPGMVNDRPRRPWPR